MLNEEELIRIIKDAGFQPVNVTQGLSDAVTDEDRQAYWSRRVQWVTKNGKGLLVVSRNDMTSKLFFNSNESNAKTDGVLLKPAQWMIISKRGAFGVVPNAKAAPILAFIRGQTGRCYLCKADSTVTGFTCNECGHTQCLACLQDSSSATKGVSCRECGTLIGYEDYVPNADDAGETKKTLETPMVMTVTKRTEPNGVASGATAEIKLPRSSGSRAQQTRLYFDPNLDLTRNTGTTFAHFFIKQGASLAQMLIDIYGARVTALERVPNSNQPNVAVCILGNTPDLSVLSSLQEAKNTLELLQSASGKEIAYRQDTAAWKASGRLLARNASKGSFALVALACFPRDVKIRVELYIVHEISRDFLVMSNGLICAKCQKPGAKKRCSRCCIIRYCSADCQSSDWRRHKLLCGRFKEDRMLAEAMTGLYNTEL